MPPAPSLPRTQRLYRLSSFAKDLSGLELCEGEPLCFGSASSPSSSAGGAKSQQGGAAKQEQGVKQEHDLDLKSGEVLVRIHAVSLNARDLQIATGTYPAPVLPPKGLVPCSDCAGEVVAVGPPSSSSSSPSIAGESGGGKPAPRWAVGDRVAACFSQEWTDGEMGNAAQESALGGGIDGVLAEYRVFPAHGLVRLPASMDYRAAACLPVAGLTAYHCLYGMPGTRLYGPDGAPVPGSGGALTRKHGQPGRAAATPAAGAGVKAEGARVKAEAKEAPADEDEDARETVLIEGTGGVSIAALQLAREAGARCIVLSSSDAKLARCVRDFGVDKDDCINYRRDRDWHKTVLKRTNDRGVHHVIEIGGKDTLPRALQCCAPYGTISVVGYMDDYKPADQKDAAPTDAPDFAKLVLYSQAVVRGVMCGSRAHFEAYMRLHAAAPAALRPCVDTAFTFARAKDAFELLASGRFFGKVVIDVVDPED